MSVIVLFFGIVAFALFLAFKSKTQAPGSSDSERDQGGYVGGVGSWIPGQWQPGSGPPPAEMQEVHHIRAFDEQSEREQKKQE